ncbi:MAG: pyrroline-5-carboxylate reductase [Tepidisphaeraceae bacterium]|jgi:pyrroline-5-carboxylate reductase
MSYDLGIIGAGNMAEAIVRGIVKARIIAPQRIIVADVSPQRRELFQSELKTAAVDDNTAAARDCRVLLLSVKPQQMAAALASFSAALSPNTLILSIAAAISTRCIEKTLGGDKPWRVVRAMPNTPMLVGEGLAAICPGTHATAADMAEARRIFSSAAEVIETTEDKMDAVTAVSGSGPAYFFYLTEQMIKAAVELGIPPAQAARMAAKTALGAARMLVESDQSPGELRRKVTSPGGTTEAAIAHLDKSGWPAATVEAVKAAARRSGELGR